MYVFAVPVVMFVKFIVKGLQPLSGTNVKLPVGPGITTADGTNAINILNTDYAGTNISFLDGGITTINDDLTYTTPASINYIKANFWPSTQKR